MNIDIANLDFSLSRPRVIEALAKVFHSDPFRPSKEHAPLNFHVHLYKAKNPVHNNSGRGLLTLPSIELGEAFLHSSNNPLKIGRRAIKFSANKKGLKSEIVEKIGLQPFSNPREGEKRDWHNEQDPSALKVEAIQFGWICRDHTFSIECEENCTDRCHITFNPERRQIRMRLRFLAEFYLVVISFTSINNISTSTNLDREHALVFNLNAPPSYEKEQVSGKRLKLSYLPIPAHERLAPFTSMAIRIVCVSQKDIQQFRDLCSIAHLNKVDDYDYPVDHRDLFGVADMITMRDHLCRLPWIVAFQMESLLRNTAIDFKEANILYPMVLQAVEDKGKEFVATALRNFRNEVNLLFNSEDDIAIEIVVLFSNIMHQLDQDIIYNPPHPIDGSLYKALHVDVTPTTMHLDGPFTEQSNRVIRTYDAKYQDCFLRVSFVDETHLQYRFDHEVDGREFITSRIGPLFRNGLKIAGRKFDFLAYSQSALKEHAVWFVKPFKVDPNSDEMTAARIVSSLGTFHNLAFDKNLIYCPARYAARLSQAFTATDAVKVDVEEVIHIDDICTSDGKYQFTDGVGTLSKELSRNIWAQLKKSKRRRLPKEVPPAYQIRFMGSKGMISVDHTLSGSVICLRPSMVKFLTEEAVNDIEIARAFDKPGPYFLNRPLIMLLEGLGVPYNIFKKYQDEAVQTTRKAASSLKEAASLLECHGLGTSYRLPWILNHLEKLSLNSIPDDDFYKKMLEYATHHVLRDLKNHSRIPVPGAWTLVGVADTHQYLQENQIFTCIKPISGGRKYLSGRVLISRSPTIHPGDVRIVEAIGAPPPGSCFEEEPLANTVVFSVQGDRPLPSCLGGGDLDGDLYNLIPLDDPELPELWDFFPRKPISIPSSYEAAPRKTLSRPSTMQDVADFVMEYISSDVVGIIAINWLIIADQSREGIFDEDCITLANLHSNAVDYPKSGQPVPLEKIPRVKGKRRPDWSAPEVKDQDSNRRFYQSRSAIGRLFHAIDLPVQQEPVTLPRRRRRQDQPRDIERLEAEFDNFDQKDARKSFLFQVIQDRVEELIKIDTDLDDELVDSIARLFRSYSVHLQAVCISNTLHAQTTQLSEGEVVVGTISQQTSQPRKRKELMAKVRESTDRLVQGIQDELAGDDSIKGEESLYRAWTAWEFSKAQGDSFGAKSFGWIALGLIFDAIKEVEDGLKNRQS